MRGLALVPVLANYTLNLPLEYVNDSVHTYLIQSSVVHKYR